MGEPDIRRVAALLRVSTEKAEQSESPEAQLLFIQEEIRRHCGGAELWADTGLVYEDELTGALVLDRPGVQCLLAHAREGRYDLVAMKSIQRLGRDTLGLLHLKRLLDDLDVELVALQDGYRSRRDPELIFLVHADRAQAGREDISRNVRNAMRQRARQGRWMAGNVPFGYRRKNRHELEPHPETAPIVQEIFRLRRLGWGASRLAGYLNRSGIPAPAWWAARDRLGRLGELAAADERFRHRLEQCRQRVDRRPAWPAKTLRGLFGNTAYFGELRYYRSWWKVKVGGRKVLESRPPEEWITVPCPPLMTRAEWEEAQRKRLRHRGSAGARVYLLSGLLRCGRCGGRMNGSGGKVGKYGFYGYYYCQARRDRHTCTQPGVRADALEAELLGFLPKILGRLPERIVERQPSNQWVQVRIQQVAEQLVDLADQRRYYRNEHRRRRLTDQELDAELARIAAEEGRLKAEEAGARAQPLNSAERESQRRREIRERVARWQVPSETVEPVHLRTLIQAAVDRIVCRGPGDMDLYLRLGEP